ncbi:Fc.00g109040.m01.CDS01 [Cosmosporella sp. VM-42]
MSPPRRRSARLASASAVKTKATPGLSSVAECAESPSNRLSRRQIGAFPSSPNPAPSTPSSSAVKPPSDEMHPSKFKQSIGEPSSALRLGFTDIKSAGRDTSRTPGGLQSTPSKIGVLPPSSPFTFRFAREAAETELSGDARRMMEELRSKAAEIKAEMVAKREAEGDGFDGQGRKIAKPRGKSGRFSAAHMAEFKKMDSIENHASAWRAEKGRFTPVSGLKRSPSKANLDATTPTSQTKSGLKRSPSKPDLNIPPATPRMKANLKRSSSRANLDEYQQSPSPKKTAPPVSTSRPLLGNFGQRSTAKRLKKSMEDDASSARPISRDGTSIPRPTSSKGLGNLTYSNSSLARLMSPTKASLAHVASQGRSTVSLVESPSKSDLGGGLTRSATTGNLSSASKPLIPRGRVISPGRFQKVKSILRGQRTPSGKAQTAIPQPAISQTPDPTRVVDKELPPLPLTTPRRKLTKHVAFTPEVTRAAVEQNSPSPQKFTGFSKTRLTKELEEAQYPALAGVLAQAKSGEVKYPDLSGFRPLPEPPKDREILKPSVPGTFSFRSDHTIKFGDPPPTGFGASPGQSSVRHVRGSTKPTEMPGSFPEPSSAISHPNKENKAPAPTRMLFKAHGMSNKKRHRATWDEEESELETDGRAAKKRKNEHVPEGQALLAPRLVASTPKSSAKKPQATPRTPGTASPTKKRGLLSMSRLNMLARPKNRT